MKISQSEIDAAYDVWKATAGKKNELWAAILEAALKVRKARKKAKRERQRKEKDKQVQESVGPIGVLLGIDPFCEAPDSKA